MNQKFALITDTDNWSDETGVRIVTYSSPWDNAGWTALKSITLASADMMASILAAEGYCIVRSREQLKAAMEAAQAIELQRAR